MSDIAAVIESLSLESVLNEVEEATLEPVYSTEGQNLAGESSGRNSIVKGDNLRALKALYDEGVTVDLVYADPPFATGRKFNMGDGEEVNQFSKTGESAYSDEESGEDYLNSLAKRLILIREILSNEGSIYLHIDNEMGAYVKVLMDEVFGSENYCNTISRVKCNPKNFSRDAYGNQTDMILFYSKTGNHIWNDPRQDYTQDQLDRLFSKTDEDGRRFTTTPLHAPGETEDGPTGEPWKGMEPAEGRHWRYPPEKLTELDEAGRIYWSSNGNPRKKRYADEADGPKRQDIWKFKDPQSVEYPTQKNLDLLETIVAASSEEGSTVLDPYCGGGTTPVAASKLGRRFIGLDASEAAISVQEDRLEETPYTRYRVQSESK